MLEGQPVEDRVVLRPGRAPGRCERTWLLCLGLLTAYVLIAVVFNLSGALGADTGPKIATLRSMDERSSIVPDVGYWAKADDPIGLLHPLYSTRAIDGHFVVVTTLPMLIAAAPLYAAGGSRLALALPMVGALGCALAARSLARRLGAASPNVIFWAVGLGSPVLIYALDFWEHTLGLCFMLWAVVLLVDACRAQTKQVARAVAGGALFGLAATMRSEAFVYGAVLTLAVFGYDVVRSKDLRAFVARGFGALVGIIGVVTANELLERALLGSSIRTGRAGATASGAGGATSARVREALHTSLDLGFGQHDRVISIVCVIALGGAAWAAARREPQRRVWLLFGLAAAIVAFRVVPAVDFVPGFLAAFPLAVAGLAVGVANSRSRTIAVAAIVSLPFVWCVQYLDNTDWGGRYVLTTGILLGVAGFVALAPVAPRLVWGFIALGVALTGLGVVFTAQRSRAVDRLSAHVSALHDNVVISRDTYLLRYAGDVYEPSRRWLTANSRANFTKAIAIADRASGNELDVVSFNERDVHATIPGWRAAQSATWNLGLIPAYITRYERAG